MRRARMCVYGEIKGCHMELKLSYGVAASVGHGSREGRRVEKRGIKPEYGRTSRIVKPCS